MLKGYEDVLLTTLHKVKVDRREALYRVRTPHKQVRCLHLTEPEPYKHNALIPEDEPTKGTLNSSETFVKVPSTQTHNQPTPPSSQFAPGLTRTQSITGTLHRDNTQRSINVPRNKQLRLTSRFERAQDILDSVRLSQGNLVTSPRALHKVIQIPGGGGGVGQGYNRQSSKQKKTNPLDHYNAWSHAWAKEFKLQYGSPQTRLTIE